MYFNLHSPNYNELSIFSYVYSTILYSKCFLVFPFMIKVFNLLGIYFLLRKFEASFTFFHTFTLFIANLSYLVLHHYLSELLGIHICVGLFIGLLLFTCSKFLSMYQCHRLNYYAFIVGRYLGHSAAAEWTNTQIWFAWDT